MSQQLKYMPILRGRQQELIVLKSFNFGQSIYPCLEIIKELDRLPPKPRKNIKKQSKLNKEKAAKSFVDVYLPLIQNIKAEKVFIDLPIHLKDSSKMKPETLQFLRSVVAIRTNRTEYIKKLAPLASKVIPVISTYHGRTNEQNSILLQENDLRKDFATIAFRTFADSFFRDIVQIETVLKANDFIIMDWENAELDLEDGDQQDIIERLKSLNCTIVVHRNAIPKEITNVGLEHGEVVARIDNTLLNKYEDFMGSCFSDYAGIKKDEIGKGGSVSPGFIYYDAVENNFYGFKGKYQVPQTYETIIIPAVIESSSSIRMLSSPNDYLSIENLGWKTLTNIQSRLEPGQSAAKFKKISMEHYLHCLKVKITNGDFD
jgi:Beta protein